MDLKETSIRLFNDSRNTSPRGLSAIAEAEQYLQQAYEGRYLFELIQNVRDANKEVGKDGEIHIKLKDDILSISNTGAGFSEKGIAGITTIGKSPKSSQDYIGFKGIGFKSIQEITETPRIVTQYGTVQFDRKLTLRSYDSSELLEDEIPLFYFPHFKSTKLSQEEVDQGIVTRIELPLKSEITEERVVEDFTKIQAKQLILLGNVSVLKFESTDYSSLFRIIKDSRRNSIQVIENDNILKFKLFEPPGKIELPSDVIQTLEKKEKRIFSTSPFVDVNIVMQLNDNGHIEPINNAKLYLFYPLHFSSGFRFIIHSYFVVNPERTALRDTRFNDYLLQSIAKFIAGEMLMELKRTKVNTNKVLCFKRNPDAEIDILYDTLVEELQDARFIYDSKSRKYLKPSEVMVADDTDKGLFPDGEFAGRKLIYLEHQDEQLWLRNEFDVPYLYYDDIANQIEQECKRQVRNKNIAFFQNLYNYAVQHENLNLNGKKVLLTDNWRLVASDDDVFYGGGRRKSLSLAASIRAKIHFIHRDIKISDFREGKSRTGIAEFNTYELVKRLLKLFAVSSVANIDLLNAIYNITDPDERSEQEIREKILVPIKGSGRWLSPAYHPIYIESEELRELYPDGNFVDEAGLVWQSEEGDRISSTTFLKANGVWDIPAVYISDNEVRVGGNENRDKKIENYSRFQTRPFYIENDRMLHLPKKFNSWFTQAIISNWQAYDRFICGDLFPKLKYSNNRSYWKAVDRQYTIDLCHFTEALSSQKWICMGPDEIYSIDEVVGIDNLDYHRSQNQVISKFLRLLPIDYAAQNELITTLELVHLSRYSFSNFLGLLNLTYEKYHDSIPEDKEFVKFYNRILSKLVDYSEYNRFSDREIALLSNQYFLCIDDIDKALYWEMASNIFYIDDKPAYDLLPPEIKEQVQPHFTNRDRNTFGKIAGRIGLRFSRAIIKELVNSNQISSTPLIQFFDHLPQTVALLESHFGDNLAKHFDAIRDAKVIEEENLKVKISVGNSQEMIIPVPHYIAVDSGMHIHISRQNPYVLNKNNRIAAFLNEFFINLLDRDLRNFKPILLNFLNTSNTDKMEYLRNYDIQEDKIAMIEEELKGKILSPTHRFWQSVLSAKGSFVFDPSSIHDEIDLETLARVLGVDIRQIKEFDRDFDFIETSSAKNIPSLHKLLESLNLTLARLNNVLSPKIDFSTFFINQLIKKKNREENNIKALIHGYLITASEHLRSSYQSYIDSYKYELRFEIPPDTVEMDTDEHFIIALSKLFPFLDLTPQMLLNADTNFDDISIYAHNLDLLKAKIRPFKVREDWIDAFLNSGKDRSLLYFDNVELVFNNFQEWLSRKKTNQYPQNPQSNDLYDILKSISNQDRSGIESIKTKSVCSAPPVATMMNPSFGKRYDGSKYESNRSVIGHVAEMVVFEELSAIYDNVVWVSKYASKIYQDHPGYNPEGQDGLGYDIEYINEDGNKIFVEVKGKFGSHNSFEITKNEIDKAIMEGNCYQIILVTDVMDGKKRRSRNLGNIFMFEESEDFFSNSQFTPIYQSFEIRFLEE